MGHSISGRALYMNALNIYMYIWLSIWDPIFGYITEQHCYQASCEASSVGNCGRIVTGNLKFAGIAEADAYDNFFDRLYL